MHKPVQENLTRKIPRDIEIQVDRRIPARKIYLVFIMKRNCHVVNFAVSADHRLKIECCHKAEKLWDMKMTMIPIELIFKYNLLNQ